MASAMSIVTKMPEGIETDCISYEYVEMQGRENKKSNGKSYT